MFRAIGVVLILWYLSHLFTASFMSLDHALVASFEAIAAYANAARVNIQ